MTDNCFITKREFYGKELASLVKFALKSVPENIRKDYKIKLSEELRKHEFQIRKKTDPPHPNSKKRYSLEEIPNPEFPEGLAKIIIHQLDLNYNAFTSNAIKDYLLKEI